MQDRNDIFRHDYLNGMRQVACSVAVVTTDGIAGRHGATVSAFCSVSADPPTVLICLRCDSRIACLVEHNKVFTLNILPQERQDIARTFAGEFDTMNPDRFAKVALTHLEGLAPGIDGATIFGCDVVRTEQQGSHIIFFGKVKHITAENRKPLTYLDGAYRRIQDDSIRLSA
ncbi:flavin reductase/cob(II)yrinic acid a,c-diamide reductase [Roseovarius azorensis]|uniref:Flavin reductase/cob(II)yrinic acid a,c-diamide reductase n=1 Tax=Roseovarius azorensis TaxID=1287727 RepID=A0A1H7Y1A6_9RHOB|nr:flavin reductase family protein [Roseovarius azorensis]SEM39942.1 flavin reductase/cob(II)yrinic acid a,c-diamide reductase [Roseovarius azorensis]